MQYSTPELLLLIAGVGAVFTQMITAWRTGNQITAIKDQVNTNTEKTDATLVKAAVIEGHVNSRETKLTEQAISLQKEIDLLKGVIIEKEKTSALLAQAANARTRLSDMLEAQKSTPSELPQLKMEDIPSPLEVKIVK